MKWLALALALTSASVFASPKLCPQGTTTLLTCTSNDVIAFYPYVAICEDSQDLGIMLDPGAGRTPESMNVVKSETDADLLFTATEEDADGLVLAFHKGITGKKNSTLSFQWGPIDGNLSFNCK